jgi:hypothetical protein
MSPKGEMAVKEGTVAAHLGVVRKVSDFLGSMKNGIAPKPK